MKELSLPLILLATFFLVACQSKPVTGEVVSVNGGSYKNVTPKELNVMLTNKGFVFVNVHIPFAGNIKGTDLSMPYDQIEQNLSKLPADKNARIVLYCRSGHMSTIAAEKLVSSGYTNVWSLKGGMMEWKKAGFDLEK